MGFNKLMSVLRIFPRHMSQQVLAKPTIIPVFKSCLKYKDKVGLRDDSGDYSYIGLSKVSSILSKRIDEILGKYGQQTVATLCPNDATYVIMQWACWISGRIAVPLNPNYPKEIIEYILNDCKASLLIATREYEPTVQNIKVNNTQVHILDADIRVDAEVKGNLSSTKEGQTAEKEPPVSEEGFSPDKDALILYTSGYTGPPKGVLLNFLNLESQAKSVMKAWNFTSKDCVLHARSLYSTDGISAFLIAPLSIGAKVVILQKFSPEEIWSELLGVKMPYGSRVNVLAAESWMYRQLVNEYEHSLKQSERMKDYIKGNCIQKIRLTISTNSSIPKSVMEKWQNYTGHEIIDAYGMTECGIISSTRVASSKAYGTVGYPLDGIKVKIMSEDGDSVIAEGDSSGTRILGVTSPVAGILWIKGDTVFRKYCSESEGTWSKDGWFKTDDVVSYARGLYTVLGRYGSDIVKSKSYKVSLMQIESAILDLAEVADVVAFGLPNPSGSTKIVAVISLKKDMQIDIEQIRESLLSRIPEYAIPVVFLLVPSIPRNHNGICDRAQLSSLYFPEGKNVELPQ